MVVDTLRHIEEVNIISFMIILVMITFEESTRIIVILNIVDKSLI